MDMSGNKLLCLVCSSVGGGQFFGVAQHVLPGGKCVSDRLNKVLAFDLLEWNCHSEFICCDCFHLLGRIDYLEGLLQDVTGDLIGKFLLTSSQFGLHYRLKKNRNSTTAVSVSSSAAGGATLVVPENLRVTTAGGATSAPHHGTATGLSSAQQQQQWCSVTTASSVLPSQMLLPDTLYLPEAHKAATTSLLATLPAEAFCLDYSANPPGPINMTSEMLSAAEQTANAPSTPTSCAGPSSVGASYPRAQSTGSGQQARQGDRALLSQTRLAQLAGSQGRTPCTGPASQARPTYTALPQAGGSQVPGGSAVPYGRDGAERTAVVSSGACTQQAASGAPLSVQGGCNAPFSRQTLPAPALNPTAQSTRPSSVGLEVNGSASWPRAPPSASDQNQRAPYSGTTTWAPEYNQRPRQAGYLSSAPGHTLNLVGSAQSQNVTHTRTSLPGSERTSSCPRVPPPGFNQNQGASFSRPCEVSSWRNQCPSYSRPFVQNSLLPLTSGVSLPTSLSNQNVSYARAFPASAGQSQGMPYSRSCSTGFGPGHAVPDSSTATSAQSQDSDVLSTPVKPGPSAVSMPDAGGPLCADTPGHTAAAPLRVSAAPTESGDYGVPQALELVSGLRQLNSTVESGFFTRVSSSAPGCHATGKERVPCSREAVTTVQAVSASGTASDRHQPMDCAAKTATGDSSAYTFLSPHNSDNQLAAARTKSAEDLQTGSFAEGVGALGVSGNVGFSESAVRGGNTTGSRGNNPGSRPSGSGATEACVAVSLGRAEPLAAAGSMSCVREARGGVRVAGRSGQVPCAVAGGQPTAAGSAETAGMGRDGGQSAEAALCPRGGGCQQQCVLDTDWSGLDPGQRVRLGIMPTGGVGGLLCYYCRQEGGSWAQLVDHVRCHHQPQLLHDTVLVRGQQARYKMGLRLTDVQDTDWNNAASGRPFLCVHCDGLYKTLRSLKNHFREHHTPNLTFKCPDCSELHRRQIDLSRHRLFRCVYRKQRERPPPAKRSRKRRPARRATGARSPAQQTETEAEPEPEPDPDGGPATPAGIDPEMSYDMLSDDQCFPIDLANTTCDSFYGLDYTDKKKYNFDLVNI